MAINGPAGSAPGGYQPAVRNPTYNSSGNIIGSSTPDGTPIAIPGYSSYGYGIGGAIARQLAMLNRGDPRQGNSLTEEELKKAAMRQLGGQ